MSDLLWIAIPSGFGPDGGKALLRVLVVPRLDGGRRVSDHGLADWPPAELAGAALAVDFREDPDAASLGTSSPTPRLDVQPGLWGEFFASIDIRPPGSAAERVVTVDPTSDHIQRIDGAYTAVAGAFLDADHVDEFHREVTAQLEEFRGDEEPVAPVKAPPGAAAPGPDFHRVMSLLREHPAVLRALGLIFDVDVDAADLPDVARGVVQVTWDTPPPGLPEIVPLWTAYERGVFLPAPGEESDIRAGMATVGMSKWQVHTVDVDSALNRLRDAARSEASNGVATLPALRTAGVLLVRAGRGTEITRRQGVTNARAGRVATEFPVLTADDLALGYRIDAKVVGQDWHSLTKRESDYKVNERTIAEELHEEGHLKVRAGIDHGDGNLLFDEVVATWDGWSLGAPRPALDGSTRAARATADLPFRFEPKIAVEPGTLLKLRFGKTYQLRARVADLAGGGRVLEDDSPDGCDSDPVLFTRHEPIRPPDIRLPEGVETKDLGRGAAQHVLVIRSSDNIPDSIADSTRVLVAPSAAFDVIERHGNFDEMSADTMATLQLDALPDPAADGVAAFVRREPGVTIEDFETKTWVTQSTPWPDFADKRLVLKARARGRPTLNWDSDEELVVRLGPAEQITLELSSYLLGDTMLGRFAISNWLPRDASGNAAQSAAETVTTGRHPMVTPAQAVTLVHAVRRPRESPAGALAARREEGQTFAELVPQSAPTPRPELLGVDAPSTASLDVVASWAEVDDSGSREVTDVPVGTATIGRGDTSLQAIRHEFDDTKHRVVTYSLAAITRFRQFFPDGPDDEFQTTGTVGEVDIASSARPIPPVVLSAVPAFVWSESRSDAVITRRRAGNQVRVELARPWFTTGVGEALAVICVDDEPPPDELIRFFTQVGRDPIWATRVPERFPRLAGDAEAELAETGTTVRIAPHGVWSIGESWYADVVFPPTESYSPLAQLAVARYQPSSVGDLHLSPVVRTDFVPLLPDRSLRIDPSTPDEVRVTLSGVGPEGPLPNRVAVVLEQLRDAAGPATEVTLLDGASSEAPGWVRVGSETGALEETLQLPRPTSGRLRVRVREVENIGTDPGAAPGTAAELAERTVFTDVVELG